MKTILRAKDAEVCIDTEGQVGENCIITNHLKLNGIIKAADLLLGKDDFGRAYITHYRSTQKN